MDCDILIIGGGVNGAGIARDAAGRGYRVILAEMKDLAGATSSGSTKLIHGGLRYLEYYEFSLVRKALKEREVLLALAPHIIWPLRFVLPHDRHQRPRWMIRLGLFLYDHLGGRKKLPASHGVTLGHHPLAGLLKDEFSHGFEYSDCWVEDSRLVILNAMDARARGAIILTRTECLSATATDGAWQAELKAQDGRRIEVHASMIINAAGPWAGKILSKLGKAATDDPLRLVKGSHIVVRKLHDHPHALILQNPDKRILFVIPYEGEYSLIGTTEQDFSDNPGKAHISDDEQRYLIDSVNRYLKKPLSLADIIWSYAAVRPLHDDGSQRAGAVARDYVLDNSYVDNAPLLSVYGGKITTYRVLAEDALRHIGKAIGPRGTAWTATTALPGGDIAAGDFATFLESCRKTYPWLPLSMCKRLSRAYGTRIKQIIGHATSLDQLGELITGDLYAAEVDYLRREEFALTAEDILWRRSKLGLHLCAVGDAPLRRYLDGKSN